MTRWGTDVLDRLPLRGDETVLDAGCGSGRVTERLVERLPRGRVDRARRLAVDGRGRPRAAGAVRRPGERTWSRTSAAAAAAGATRASTRSCRPRPSTGSPTTTRCSGTSPRVAAARRAARRAVRRRRATSPRSRRCCREIGDGWLGPWTFATPEETTRAARGGGVHRRSRRWLNDEPTPFEPGAPFARVPADGRPRRAPRAAAGRRPSASRSSMRSRRACRTPSIDYVRLNILATRA